MGGTASDNAIEPRGGVARVTLVRGAQRWHFECDRAGGPALTRRIAELATEGGCPLDRMDAALVCQQLDRQLLARPHKPGPDSHD